MLSINCSVNPQEAPPTWDKPHLSLTAQLQVIYHCATPTSVQSSRATPISVSPQSPRDILAEKVNSMDVHYHVLGINYIIDSIRINYY